MPNPFESYQDTEARWRDLIKSKELEYNRNYLITWAILFVYSFLFLILISMIANSINPFYFRSILIPYPFPWILWLGYFLTKEIQKFKPSNQPVESYWTNQYDFALFKLRKLNQYSNLIFLIIIIQMIIIPLIVFMVSNGLYD